MARWGPDARGRLARAALELYLERGYEGTTVAEIAERAGLTERTFFRHFADKREVLFGGAEKLQALVTAAVEGAPGGTPPIEAVAAGLEAAGEVFRGDPAHSRARQRVINATPDLRARELGKLAALGLGVAEALRRRGVPDPAAALAAEAGLVVFRAAFERWIGADDSRAWPGLVRAALADLRAAMGEG